MPVLSKETHDRLHIEFCDRTNRLRELLKKRELTSPSEGCKTRNSCWKHPEKMCATEGSKIELSIAIADFKTILHELSKL